MIFGERVPFSPPVEATGGFMPRSFDVRMYSDFHTMPGLPPMVARLPSGIRLPLQAEPGGGPLAPPAPAPIEPVAPAMAPVKGFGMFGTFGAANMSPLARAKRGLVALPAFATRPVTSARLHNRLTNALNFVNRGRNPGR